MRTEHAAARCEGVVRIYWSASGEVHALKGVDAVIPAGRLTAITGPSGSGKSSLLRILAGQDRPTAGRAEVAGESLAGLSTRRLRALRRRHVGYVFPRPPQNLLPQLTVTEHLAAAARARGTDGTDADELLDRLGLAERRTHRPAELSGGEQQRVAFAAALVGRPALVVADEPTSELDGTTTAGLLAAVHEITRSGTTVLMATHDPQAAAAADQVIHLRSGAVAHEEVGGRRLAVIDGDGRLQLPDEALALFPARRVVLELGADGVVLREPS